MWFHAVSDESPAPYFVSYPNMTAAEVVGQRDTPQGYFKGFHDHVPEDLRLSLANGLADAGIEVFRRDRLGQIIRNSSGRAIRDEAGTLDRKRALTYTPEKESALHFFYRYSMTEPRAGILSSQTSNRRGVTFPHRPENIDNYFFTFQRTQVFNMNDVGGGRGTFINQIAKEFVCLFDPIPDTLYFKLKNIDTIVHSPETNTADKLQYFKRFVNIIYKFSFHPYILNRISGFGNLNFHPTVLTDATYRILQGADTTENDQMFFDYPLVLPGDDLDTFYLRLFRSAFGRSIMSCLNYFQRYTPDRTRAIVNANAELGGLMPSFSHVFTYPPSKGGYEMPAGATTTQEAKLLHFSHKFQKQLLYLIAVYLFGAINAAGQYIYFPNIRHRNRGTTRETFSAYLPQFTSDGTTLYPILAHTLDNFIHVHNTFHKPGLEDEDVVQVIKGVIISLITKFFIGKGVLPRTPARQYTSFADHLYSDVADGDVHFDNTNRNKQMYFRGDAYDDFRLYALPNFAIINYIRNTLGPSRETATRSGPIRTGVPLGFRMYPYDMMNVIGGFIPDVFKRLSIMLSDDPVVLDRDGFGNFSRVDWQRPAYPGVPGPIPPYFDEDRPDGLNTLKQMIKNILVAKQTQLDAAVAAGDAPTKLRLMEQAYTFASNVSGASEISPGLKARIVLNLNYDDMGPHGEPDPRPIPLENIHACNRYVDIFIRMRSRTYDSQPIVELNERSRFFGETLSEPDPDPRRGRPYITVATDSRTGDPIIRGGNVYREPSVPERFNYHGYLLENLFVGSAMSTRA